MNGALNAAVKLDHRQELALMKYNSAQDEIWQALAIEKQLETRLSDKERAKLIAKRDLYFGRAARDLENSVRRRKNFAVGHKDLGFVRRSLGDYEGALEAYGRAIEIEPGFPQAIEYRAIAYLHLRRFDDVKHAYMELFGAQRNLADQLMEEMKSWVHERQSDPAGVEPDALQSFDSWIAERSEIAALTPLHTLGVAQNW